jgi:7,8-didemethyl-8-hydroxy-5-deazariboflavin synthase
MMDLINRIITYSPAYTLVPTYECFNRCSYCNFRVDLGRGSWLSLDSAEKILKSLPTQVREILILSGEVHPLASNRTEWFEGIYQLCQLILSLGFLPHTNVGPLNWSEMERLKEVNVSMGLMLEQLNPKFLTTVHRQAPSKNPELRLQQLAWAGKLQIPFTTGLLLGIGEDSNDRLASLEAIADLQAQWGHIQEVILQPHSWGTRQESTNYSFQLHLLPEVVLQAREILPDNIAIQVPPNLIDEPQILLDCLKAGARDLGGISPKDEVNPDYPHPTYESLTAILQPAGWQLVPRLPVYPQYYSWLPSSLQRLVRQTV